MKLEDMTKGYLLALYSNIESLLAKDSSWGVLDKKVNREFNTDAKKAVFGFMQMIPPTDKEWLRRFGLGVGSPLSKKYQRTERKRFWVLWKSKVQKIDSSPENTPQNEAEK